MRELTLHEVQTLLNEGVAYAQSIGLPSSMAVVDMGGMLRGVLRPEKGRIANPERTQCVQCGERMAYVPGYSDDHGVCGCAPGYYNARTTLIVCLQNGFKPLEQDNTFHTLCDSEDLTPNGTVISKNGTTTEHTYGKHMVFVMRVHKRLKKNIKIF